MKLTNIVPIIVETDEEDIYASKPLPTEPEELLKHLERKEAAIVHLKRQVSGSIGGSAQQRENQLDTAQKKVHAQVLKVRKVVLVQQIAIKQSGKTSKQIPESDVPVRIRTGANGFKNPYFDSDEGRYAGDPAFFEWSSTMLLQYNRLDNALTSRGFKGFTVIYSSVINNITNFAAIGANGSFVWRRKDKGDGYGFNVVNAGGIQTSTSSFVYNEQYNQKENDAMLASLK